MADTYKTKEGYIMKLSKLFLGLLLLESISCNVYAMEKNPLNRFDENGWTPLTKAIKMGQPFRVEILLRAGANVNLPATCSITPLVAAVLMKNEEIVKKLIEFGANVNQPAQMNATPLHFAAIMGSLSILRLLISHGAQTSSKCDADFLDKFDENLDKIVAEKREVV